MKRTLLWLIIVIIAAIVAAIALRQRAGVSQVTVTSLLPSETAIFLHIPDLQKSRDDWHKTDLYQLYREPAVQDFLQQPITQFPRQTILVDAVHDSATLRMRNVFVASNSFDNPRVIAGFEFQCDERQASAVLEQWKFRFVSTNLGAQRSTIDYENHHIDVISTPKVTIASLVIGKRFFAATKVDDLKLLLDRLDRRNKAPGLEADATFRSALKQMPGAYAGLLYVQPRELAQKLITLRAQAGSIPPAKEQSLLERVQSFSQALVFEGGKIRGVSFAAMPRLSESRLSRDTLAMASAETVLYLAAILNLQQQIDAILPSQNSSVPAGLQPANKALATAGISAAEVRAAFGDELSLLIEWPQNLRLPSGVATLAIRDAAAAKKTVAALAASYGWQLSNRDNGTYYTGPSSGALFAVAPVIALSDRLLVFGLDTASVDRAVSPTRPKNPVINSSPFRDAAKLVPDPQQMFIYLDLATLYTRLDSALRPVLQMSAALMPSVAERFDPQKLPKSEVVTKHLSPVVASQVYTDGGYRAESVGPITIGHTVGLAAAIYVATEFGKRPWTAKPSLGPALSATPSVPITSPSPIP